MSDDKKSAETELGVVVGEEAVDDKADMRRMGKVIPLLNLKADA